MRDWIERSEPVDNHYWQEAVASTMELLVLIGIRKQHPYTDGLPGVPIDPTIRAQQLIERGVLFSKVSLVIFCQGVSDFVSQPTLIACAACGKVETGPSEQIQNLVYRCGGCLIILYLLESLLSLTLEISTQA